MKKAIAILSTVLCAAALADEVVATTLLADGSTNTWTQADLRDALGLMNRMYHRDDAGRPPRRPRPDEPHVPPRHGN